MRYFKVAPHVWRRETSQWRRGAKSWLLLLFTVALCETPARKRLALAHFDAPLRAGRNRAYSVVGRVKFSLLTDLSLG